MRPIAKNKNKTSERKFTCVFISIASTPVWRTAIFSGRVLEEFIC